MQFLRHGTLPNNFWLTWFTIDFLGVTKEINEVRFEFHALNQFRTAFCLNNLPTTTTLSLIIGINNSHPFNVGQHTTTMVNRQNGSTLFHLWRSPFQVFSNSYNVQLFEPLRHKWSLITIIISLCCSARYFLENSSGNSECQSFRGRTRFLYHTNQIKACNNCFEIVLYWDSSTVNYLLSRLDIRVNN